MPSPGHINPPSALGLLAHAVDALERPNLTPVVASQSLPSNNARPANFEIELHGDDAPPRSITPGLDPDIAAMFGNEKAKTSKKEAASVSAMTQRLILLSSRWKVCARSGS